MDEFLEVCLAWSGVWHGWCTLAPHAPLHLELSTHRHTQHAQTRAAPTARPSCACARTHASLRPAYAQLNSTKHAQVRIHRSSFMRLRVARKGDAAEVGFFNALVEDRCAFVVVWCLCLGQMVYDNWL